MAPLSTRFAISCVFLAAITFYVVSSDNPNDADLETALKILLSPEENSLQVQALRREVLRKFQDALEQADEEDQESFKRSLSSLAAWNNLPEHKRNLEALARAGYLRTLPDEDDADSSYKRSIAALAKNGQLPLQSEGLKRGLESLARNGDLRPKKELQQMMEEMYKRNIGSLARNYNFPSYGKRSLSSLARSGDLNFQRFQYKRNIASLARDGKFTGKRNVAALLRNDEYLNNLRKQDSDNSNSEDRGEKRNIASIKAQYKQKFKRSTHEKTGRNKREADYYYQENGEYLPPAYNPNVYDYEDLMQDLSAIYPNNDKRFLGSVARTGWFRPSSSRFSQYVSPEKRHIGSLARLGWLPSFRNVRRFNRSGRSTSSDDTCRETTSDGETENNSISKEPSISVEGKRFLLQPAVDNILLRKFFMHPRSH